jgi:hypothetical protein
LMTFCCLSRAGYWINTLTSSNNKEVYYTEENNIIYVRNYQDDYLREKSDDENQQIDDPPSNTAWQKIDIELLVKKGDLNRWALWSNNDVERWIMLTEIANNDDYQP